MFRFAVAAVHILAYIAIGYFGGWELGLAIFVATWMNNLEKFGIN